MRPTPLAGSVKDISLALLCLPFIATIYVCADVVDRINEWGERL